MDVAKHHLRGGHNDYDINPTGLLIHYISARYTNPKDPYDPHVIWWVLRRYKVAYHDLICRDGRIWELVPAPLRAWHAGESHWNGKDDCNSWMLGLALVGTHGNPFTAEQYDALAERTAQYVGQYPIQFENVTGHENVAPNRKEDPGPSFDWEWYRYSIAGLWPPEQI